jgi:selenocysteine lyase/cysteine desulfurase
MTSKKHLFDLESGVHYLNCAYMSPISSATAEAGIMAVARKMRPYSITPNDFFTDVDRLKTLFAQLVNAEHRDRIALIPSVSYGMAIVAKNLKTQKGQNIVVTEAQFPSNVYAWRELAKERDLIVKTVPYPIEMPDGRGKTWNERILDSIDSNTTLVTLGHVHWANGTLFDLKKISKRCREVGAILVIDGTQSVGALPFDVQDFGVDALICGGYKTLMGAYSLGYAYLGSYFDGGKPLEETWMSRRDSENFADLLNYKDEYHPLSIRYDMGEKSNFIAVPMGIVALTEILERDVANIQNYSKKLTSEAIKQWTNAGFWVENEEYRSHHLFGLQLPAHISSDNLLAKLKENKVLVSVRGDFVRISTNVYNDEADVAALTEVLLSY